MKTLTRKCFFILFSGAILLFFASCNNLTQSSNPKANESGAEYAYVRIGIHNSSARNIYPDLSLNNLTYTLKGKWEDETTDQTITSGTWSQISTEQLELQTGEWQFTLTAVHTTTNKTFTATLNTTVTTSTTSLNFTLHADEDYGDFSISVNFTKDDDFSPTTTLKVEFTLLDNDIEIFGPILKTYEGTELNFAPSTPYSVVTGDFDMVIKVLADDLYDNDGHNIILNSKTEKFHIIGGLKTTATIKL